MKPYFLALLGAFSLSACAQSATPAAERGRQGNGAASAAAAPAVVPGSADARARDAIHKLNAKVQIDHHRRRADPRFPRSHRRRPDAVRQRRRPLHAAGQPVRHGRQARPQPGQRGEAAPRAAQDHPGQRSHRVRAAESEVHRDGVHRRRVRVLPQAAFADRRLQPRRASRCSTWRSRAWASAARTSRRWSTSGARPTASRR